MRATSSGEIVDFELSERLEVAEFRERLVSSLPSDLSVYFVKEVNMKAPAATQILEQAEYLITVTGVEIVSQTQWENWVKQVINSAEILWEKTTSSGKKQEVNLRDRLFELNINHWEDDGAMVFKYVSTFLVTTK